MYQHSQIQLLLLVDLFHLIVFFIYKDVEIWKGIILLTSGNIIHTYEFDLTIDYWTRPDMAGIDQ